MSELLECSQRQARRRVDDGMAAMIPATAAETSALSVELSPARATDTPDGGQL